jgi:polar amino acid transport system substrate-binding protein
MRLTLRTVTGLLALLLASATAAAGTLDDVKKRGVLIAGVRYDMPPYGYVEQGSSPSGIDIEIVKRIATKLGVEPQLQQVTAQTRIPMLLNGNVDVIAAGIAHTQERDAVIDYTVTYFVSGNLFLVKKDSGINSYRDLKDKTVATVQGTPYIGGLQRKEPTVKPLTFQEYPQAVLAVEQGKADALMADDTTLVGLIKGKTDRLKLVGDVRDFPRWFVGLGVRQNDSKWRNFLNFTLIEMWQDGSLKEIAAQQGLSYPPEFEIEPWQF